MARHGGGRREFHVVRVGLVGWLREVPGVFGRRDSTRPRRVLKSVSSLDIVVIKSKYFHSFPVFNKKEEKDNSWERVRECVCVSACVRER